MLKVDQTNRNVYVLVAPSNAMERHLRGCRTCITAAVLQPAELTAGLLGNCQPNGPAAV